MDIKAELSKFREYVGCYGKLNDIKINDEIIKDVGSYDRLNRILRLGIIKDILNEE